MNIKEIIKNNRNNIKKVIRLITGQENEDIEQELYIKVWKSSDSYCECGKITGWLGMIAKNLSKDYIKSSVIKENNLLIKDEEVINIQQDKADCPESALLRKERQKRIVKAINSLKPKLKEVIMLYEIDGLTYEYIAQMLNCPIGTVKSRLFTAKKQLAEMLEDMI